MIFFSAPKRRDTVLEAYVCTYVRPYLQTYLHPTLLKFITNNALCMLNASYPLSLLHVLAEHAPAQLDKEHAKKTG